MTTAILFLIALACSACVVPAPRCLRERCDIGPGWVAEERDGGQVLAFQPEPRRCVCLAREGGAP